MNAAQLNPYLMFAETEDRHHFAPNATHSRTYDLKLAPGPIEVGYAVDCSWELVDGTVDEIPDDFPISANSVEAYKIWVSLGKGLTPTGTGIANVRVEVFDWQGVDTIDRVLIECPNLFNGNVEASLSTVDDESFIYYGQIQNSLNAPIGDYPLLVTVEDVYEDPNLGPVAAYQVATAHVTLTGVWIRELVLIPAGDFIMGGDPNIDPLVEPWLGETPQHINTTGEYYIGKYEITNEEYSAFMTDGGYFDPTYWSAEGWEWRVSESWTEPESWGGKSMGIHLPDYPTWNLRWFETEAFNNWAGGRLPTEAEWEKAARGTDGRIYPWGNEWDPSRCWHNHSAWGPKPVGSFSPEGDSPYGLADCSGNAEEWGADWWNWEIYDQYAAGDYTPPTESSFEDSRICRGGNFGSKWIDGNLRTSGRNGLQSDLPVWTNGAGFRIVFDP